MIAAVTTDYAGRNVDLAVLQTIDSINLEPKVLQLAFADDGNRPYYIGGIQKLAQRYVILMLTALGSNEYAPSAGTAFIRAYLNSSLTRREQIVHLFTLGNTQVVDQIRREDRNPLFGPVPPLDEQISTVELLSYELDTTTATLRLRVKIVAQSGAATVFVMPVNSI